MSLFITITLEVTAEEGAVVMAALAAERKPELEPEPELELEPVPVAVNGTPAAMPKGEDLRAWRVFHGLTQRDAATLSGFHQGRWSRWERKPRARVRLKAKDRDAFRQWWSHRPQE